MVKDYTGTESNLVLTETVGILVVAGAALLTGLSGKVVEAGTAPRGITNLTGAAYLTATTGATVWVAVVACYALVTAGPSVTRLAQTPARRLVTDPRLRPSHITLTVCVVIKFNLLLQFGIKCMHQMNVLKSSNTLISKSSCVGLSTSIYKFI